MTDIKNTIDYINDLYEDVSEEVHFDYENREKTKVYINNEKFEEVDLLNISYEYDDFYFTKEFRKVIKNGNKYELLNKDDDYDEDISFTFPRNSSHLVTIQSGLKIPYEEIHSLIINKAKDVAIQLIQTSYIKYLYEENEKIVRDNKKVVKMYDGIQQYIINLSEENIQLKKRMDELEKGLINVSLGKKIVRKEI
jgi:hypothetical protein